MWLYFFKIRDAEVCYTGNGHASMRSSGVFFCLMLGLVALLFLNYGVHWDSPKISFKLSMKLDTLRKIGFPEKDMATNPNRISLLGSGKSLVKQWLRRIFPRKPPWASQFEYCKYQGCWPKPRTNMENPRKWESAIIIGKTGSLKQIVDLNMNNELFQS